MSSRYAVFRIRATSWMGVALLVALPGLSSSRAAENACVDYGAHARVVGQLATPDRALDVAPWGSRAVVAVEGSGLVVVDLGDPTAPEIEGRVMTPGAAVGVAVEGTHAFVADQSAGLVVVDLSDPALPEIVSTVKLGASLQNVAALGNAAYVHGFSLHVVDVTDPGAPVEVDTRFGIGSSGGIVVDGGRLAIAASDFELHDASTPTELAFLGTCELEGLVHDVALRGDRAYASSQFGLHAIDLSDAAEPAVVASHDPSFEIGLYGGMVLAENTVVLTAGGNGLLLIDVTDDDPRHVGRVGFPGLAHRVVAVGSHAVVAADEGGVVVVDVTVPRSPEVVLGVDATDAGLGAGVTGTHAVLADGLDGIKIVDVTDLDDKPPVIPLDTPGSATDVATVEGHLLVADAWSGVEVVDLTDPATPVLLPTAGLAGTAVAIDVVGDRVYVARETDGIEIADASDPTSLLGLGTVDTEDARDVAASGTFAYVADGPGGLRVVDGSDPATPVVVGTLGFPDDAVCVAVGGDVAFVGTSAGIHVVDVASPSTPVELVVLPVVSEPSAIVVSGVHAYVATDDAGLQVIDVSVPDAPFLVGGAAVGSSARGVAVWGDHVYYLADEAGLHVVHRQCSDATPIEGVPGTPVAPSPARLTLTAAPNPFTGSLRLRAGIPVAGPLTLDVFDATGRAVDARDLGWAEAGAWDLILDGVDGHGRSLPPGVWFVRLRSGPDTSGIRRVVRVR